MISMKDKINISVNIFVDYISEFVNKVSLVDTENIFVVNYLKEQCCSLKADIRPLYFC